MTEFPVVLSGTDDVLMWAPEHEVEPQALAQIRSMTGMRGNPRLRIMPDVHLGKGAVVGSVIAMADALAPAAVGVDLGCGVEGSRTDLRVEDLPDDLGPLRSLIEAAVPVGRSAHDEPVDVRRLGLPSDTAFWSAFDDLHPGVQDRRGLATRQLGSLGGGNHFVEVCSDATGRVWVTLHSGSRNIGKEVADRHIAAAAGLEVNRGLADRDLAVFLRGTPEIEAYRRDLYWAQEFAARSRAVMLALVERELTRYFADRGRAVAFDERVSCHHNYVSEEVVDGVEMIVTRKGAISARAGEKGIIPGSMATGSYVVTGLGSERSFNSASHGAGRRLSRGAAKRAFTSEDVLAQTAGVECRKDDGVIDELPGAYKRIEDVIAAQSDLVRVDARLSTLLCVKG